MYIENVKSRKIPKAKQNIQMKANQTYFPDCYNFSISLVYKDNVLSLIFSDVELVKIVLLLGLNITINFATSINHIGVLSYG
jgi:hypothetical protein